ncbi:TPA: hypothetical protein J4786_003286 [Citrobacter amalonaticus]|nr:hypothetical protein [Citrobacter amalonaticus]HAZ4787840.1 hypothetical protein [Citrobacter amalonaticus]
MQTIIKPARRFIPDYVISYEQNRRIHEILEPHDRQMDDGMSARDCVMPLLLAWQEAYSLQGIELTVDQVLIFLIRGTYPELMKRT